MKKTKIKAIVFDCVGPLLIRKKSWRPNKITLLINELCGQATSDQLFWQETKKKFHLNESQVNKVIRSISQGYKKNTAVWQLIEKLKGSYQLGLLNNGTEAVFKRWNKIFNFEKIFNLMVNSAMIGIKKPDKKVFNFVLNCLKIKPEEMMFVDDDPKNIDAAAKLKIKTVLYDQKKNNLFFKKMERL